MHWSEVIVLFLMIYFLRRFLTRHHLKSLIKVGFLVILFLMLRIGFNYYENAQSEILVHEFFKEKIISVKEKDKVVFFVKNSKNLEKQKKYIIEPYLVARRVNDFKIIFVPQNVKSLFINVLFMYFLRADCIGASVLLISVVKPHRSFTDALYHINKSPV